MCKKIIYILIFCLIISCSSPNNPDEAIFLNYKGTYSSRYGNIYLENGTLLCYELGVNTKSSEAKIYNASINFDISEDKIIVNVYQDNQKKETFEANKISETIDYKDYKDYTNGTYNPPTSFKEEDYALNIYDALIPQNGEYYRELLNEYRGYFPNYGEYIPRTVRVGYYKTDVGYKAYILNDHNIGNGPGSSRRDYRIFFTHSFLSISDLINGDIPVFAVYSPAEVQKVLNQLSAIYIIFPEDGIK